MLPAYQIPGNDIARAFTGVRQIANKPRFLRDVLTIKKERGDKAWGNLRIAKKERAAS